MVQEIKLDQNELDRLVEKLEQAPDILKDAKRQAFEMAAPKMKAALDSEIGGTGKVQRWQGQYVGSKGGYAAVRPLKDTYTEATKKKSNRYAVGYVTNAINSGHRFPAPSGRPGYKPRIYSGRQNVAGKQFYEAAEAKLPEIAQAAAEQVVNTLVEHLEG